MGPQWRTFLDQVVVDHQRWQLARFARFCTAYSTEPDRVTDAHLERFRDELSFSQLTGDPDEIHKDTARNFNRVLCDGQINRPPLEVPRKQRYLAASLTTYPESLQADIDAYIGRLANPDHFDDTGIDRPMAQTSLRNTRQHLAQTLDAAVRAGYPPTRFSALADLIDITVITAAFDVIAARIGRKAPSTLVNISATLLAIARHHVDAPKETVRRLEQAKRKISRENGGGRPRMTEKNERRLHQFDDPDAVIDLIDLPELLMTRADREEGSRRATLLAMRACAIAILLDCPMRAKNLAALDIERNLIVIKAGRKRQYALHIPADEVKNRAPLDADLGLVTSALIWQYIDKHRQHALDVPSSALFPRRNGEPRQPKHLGEDLTKLVRKETGLDINPHLYRHFAAKTILEARPGDYETARRVLGHAKMDTTTGFYEGVNSRAAHKLYTSIVESTRAKRGKKGKT